MKPKRTLKFNYGAEAARNVFLSAYGEQARKCLDWLEQETRLAPETGILIPGPGDRRLKIITPPTSAGLFRCRAVYIYNGAAVMWLKFTYEFIPAPEA